MNKIASIILIIIIFCFFNVECIFSNSLIKENNNLKINIYIKNYISFKNYDIEIILKNKSNDTILIPWSISNIFMNNNDLPKLFIYLCDSNGCYIIKNNATRINFDKQLEILKIPPQSQIVEKINIFFLFGELIPKHEFIFIKYINNNEIYNNYHCAKYNIVSNNIELPQ